MRVERLAIDGPLLLTPEVFADERGFFSESWNRRSFADALGISPQKVCDFHQDNHSRSVRGVLRGLHYQLEPEPQAKLVRCIHGAILDVAVDLRRSSASFGRWVAAMLSDENHKQLWVPVGFAHGFLTLSDTADVLYKTSGYWSKACERSLLWNDPTVAIEWPTEVLVDGQPLLAEKDAMAPTLAERIAAGDVFP